MHQAQTGAGHPAARTRGNDVLAQRQGDDEQQGRADQRRPERHPERAGGAPRGLYREEIGGVPDGHRQGEQVAEQGIGALPAVGPGGHGEGAGDGQRERQNEAAARALFPDDPGEQGHDHGGEVAEDRRIGDRGHDDAVVPKGQVQHEEQPGQQHPARRGAQPPTLSASLRRGQQGQQGQGEQEPPEARRRRACLGQPHEDGGQPQHHGRQHQHRQRKDRMAGEGGDRSRGADHGALYPFSSGPGRRYQGG